MSSAIATAYVQLQPTAEGMEKNIENIISEASGKAQTSTLTQVGSSATSAAKALAPVSAAATALGGVMLKSAMDFDAGMSQVQAISGAAGQDLEDLREKAQYMGATTKFSATEATEAMTYMGMAGWNAGQMIDGISGIMNLAAASGEELGTTSDIVTDALTAMGYQAGDAGRMADVLSAAATKSNTNVSMMGETFKYAAAVGGSLGYSMEDVALASGLMANAGIKSSQAGTALRSIMTRLATDAGASSKSLGALGVLTEELGVQFYNTDGSARDLRDVINDTRVAWAGLTDEEATNYAKKIAGQNAISGWMALMNASEDDVNKLTTAIDGSSESMALLKDGSVIPLSEALAAGETEFTEYNGLAEAMASIMEDNLNGKVTELKSAFEGLSIELMEALMPHLETLVGTLTEVVRWFTGLDEGTQKWILTAGGIAIAAAPVLGAFGSICTGINNVITIGSKLSAGIPILTNAVGGLTSSAGILTTALGGAATACLGFADAVILAYDVQALHEAASTYTQAQQTHLRENEQVMAQYENLYRTKGKEVADQWALMAYNIDTTGMSLEQAQQALVDEVGHQWDGVPQNMWDGFKQGWDYYFGADGKGLSALLGDAFTGAVDWVESILGIGSPSTVFKGIANDMWSGFQIGATGPSWDAVYRALGSAVEGIAKIFDKAPENLKTIGSNVITGMAKGIGDGWNALTSSLNSVGRNLGTWMNGLNNAKDSMSTIGKNLMTSLANGIIGAANAAMQAAANAARAVVSTVESVFRVGSPSKVFTEIGGYLMEGLENGIKDESDGVLETLQGVTGAAISAATITPEAPAGENRVADLLERYLPMLASLEVTLNGAVVGELAPGMDDALGTRAYYRSREVVTA